MEYRQIKKRTSVFALSHPWRYGVVGGGFAFLLLLRLHVVPAVAVLGGAVWYVVTAMSMRFGPGRQITQTRLAGLQDTASHVKTRFGTRLWHKLAIAFLAAFALLVVAAFVWSPK